MDDASKSTLLQTAVVLTLLLSPPGQAKEAMPSASSPDKLTISIVLNPVASDVTDKGGGLRSVVFYSSHSIRLEPDAQWPDGTPVSASIPLPPDRLHALLNDLTNHGIWRNAHAYSSEYASATASPPSALPNITAYQRPSYAHTKVEAAIFNGEYFRIFIAEVPWQRTRPFLITLRSYMPPSTLDSLIQTTQRFSPR